MRDTIEQLQSYVWMILHHRWIALGAAVVLCVTGWIILEFWPNQYEVSTKVYLDTQSVLKPLLAGLAVDNTVREQSALVMRRTLVSRPNLEQVVRDADLDHSVTSQEKLERLIADLAKDIKITSVDIPGIRSPKQESNIYLISYRHANPKAAHKVVDSLLNIFVERVLGTGRKDAAEAQEFLETQIKEYAKKLEIAEDKVKQFKLDNSGLMPKEGQNYFLQLQQLQSKIDETRLSLREAQNRSVELKRQIQAVVDSVRGASNEAVPLAPSPLDVRIQNMETKLDELLLQYTEQHPDVASTRRTLEELRAEKLREKTEPKSADVSKTDLINTKAYQDLKVLDGQTEGEIAALQARVAEYEKKLAELKPLVDTIPKVEAELTKLDRDYNIIKKTYEELVQRRESARISQGAQETADESQFRIIEPPRVPLVPISPDRLLLSTIILVTGIVAGAGVGWFVAQVTPTFYSRNQVASTVDLPVLGSVLMSWTPAEIAKRRIGLVMYGVGFCVLISAYVMVMIHNNVDLTPVLDAIRDMRNHVA